jgi:hypothetical protein
VVEDEDEGADETEAEGVVELAMLLSEEPEVEVEVETEAEAVVAGEGPLEPAGVEKATVALAGFINEPDELEAELVAEELTGLPHPEQNLACRGRFFLPQEEHT